MIVLPVIQDGKLVEGVSQYDSLSRENKEKVDGFFDSKFYYAVFGDDGITDETIPSADVRNYCKKAGRKFSVQEIATLVFLNPLLTFEDRIGLYKSIASVANGEEDAAFVEQLKSVIKNDIAVREKFLRKEEGAIYSYRIHAKNWSRDVYGYFSSEEKARLTVEDYIKDNFEDFKIKPLYSVKKNYLDSPLEISFKYNSEGKMLDFYTSYEKGTELDFGDIDYEKDFRFQYVEIPYPFRQGDFVKTIGDEDTGIFTGARNDEEMKEKQEFLRKLNAEHHLDESDISLRAEYFDEESREFFHSHPFIPTLEFASLPDDFKYKEIFEVSSDLLKGKGSLEVFQYVLKKNEVK